MPQTYTITNHFADTSIKELLEVHLLIPRKIRHFLRTKKQVTIKGQPVTWQTRVPLGEDLTLTFDDQDYPERQVIFGDKSLVEVLYEDDHLIVVNKPEGMKTHGNDPTEIALLNHVSAHVGQPCHVVHRLDMETSGAILFAKNQFILPIVNRLLEEKQIQRRYLALVDGRLSEAVTLTHKIGRHRHDRRKRVVDPKSGQAALTRVSPQTSYGRQTLVSCQLETGRTHQIRVHLSHHGLPLIGDPLYHPKPKGRLMLHAYQLELTHPLTRAELTITCQSESFDQLLQQKSR